MENPYWDEVKKLPHDELMSWRDPSRFTPESYGPRGSRRGVGTKQKTRTELVQEYAWAIPSPSAITFIVKALDGRPVVELGAGTGYWAWLLAQSGVVINAYDQHPPSQGQNRYHCPTSTQIAPYSDRARRKHQEWHERFANLASIIEDIAEDIAADAPDELAKIPVPEKYTKPYEPLPEMGEQELPDGTPGPEYHPVLQGGPEVLMLPENRDRVLFLSWPPYDNPFGTDVVRAYKGDTIVYIGEEEWGCCGDDDLHELLNREWVEVARFEDHVQWGGIHDELVVYRRKGA